MDTQTKKPRGFQCMDPAFQQSVASAGGKAAHAKGTAHVWTSDTAREAGRKGGMARAERNRQRAALQQANAIQSTPQDVSPISLQSEAQA